MNGRGKHAFDLVVHGEIWVDGALGECVRVGHTFYPLAEGLRFPHLSREYDPVTALLRHGTRVVGSFLSHSFGDDLQTTHPRGFRRGDHVRLGHVAAFDESTGKGLLGNGTPFHMTDVLAIGRGTPEVGEAVEYTLDGEGKAVRVTGPFGTHISRTGGRVRPLSSEA